MSKGFLVLALVGSVLCGEDGGFLLRENHQEHVKDTAMHSKQNIQRKIVKTPEIPCPEYWRYAEEHGHHIAYLTIPNNVDKKFNLTIETTIAKIIKHEGLKYELLSKASEVMHNKPLVFKVSFIDQHVLPKLVKIIYNGNVICSGAPDRVLAGGVSFRTNEFELDLVQKHTKEWDIE